MSVSVNGLLLPATKHLAVATSPHDWLVSFGVLSSVQCDMCS